MLLIVMSHSRTLPSKRRPSGMLLPQAALSGQPLFCCREVGSRAGLESQQLTTLTAGPA